jgi:hypothetical protein
MREIKKERESNEYTSGSKSFRTVDFASRLVMIIESTNFEFRFYLA